MIGKKFVHLSKAAINAKQPLLFPVYNKNGTLLLEKGKILTNEQVRKIMALDEIYTVNRAMGTAMYDQKEEPSKTSAFRLPPPFERINAIEKLLTEIYRKPNHPLTLSKILTIVNRLQTICEKSPDAVLAKIILDNNDNYTIKHAIHTAILCELTAKYLQWDVEKNRSLIAAALTMNMSMGLMQNKLVNQAEPLTIEQKQIIHDHPTESVLLLKTIGVQNKDWLQFVAAHHESPDGNGYPQGLKDGDISLGASLISLSDIYCAKVSGRNYRKPIYANVAARDIFLEKDQFTTETLIEVFVKILGLYPPGSLVKLESNELGLVVRRGERVDAPTVQVLSKNKYGQISLLNVKRQTSQKNYAIKSIVPLDSTEAIFNPIDVWHN